MPNPNNNKHFNDEALKINRTLKKDNDALKEEIESLWRDLSRCEKMIAKHVDSRIEIAKLSEIIDEVEDFLLNVNTQWEDDKQIGRLQQMITKVRSRDEN